MLGIVKAWFQQVSFYPDGEVSLPTFTEPCVICLVLNSHDLFTCIQWVSILQLNKEVFIPVKHILDWDIVLLDAATELYCSLSLQELFIFLSLSDTTSCAWELHVLNTLFLALHSGLPFLLELQSLEIHQAENHWHIQVY